MVMARSVSFAGTPASTQESTYSAASVPRVSPGTDDEHVGAERHGHADLVGALQPVHENGMHVRHAALRAPRFP